MEAAAPIDDKKNKEDEIRKKEKELLQKYFDGRKYNEEKIKKWSDSMLEEMNDYLKIKYPLYDYGIFLFISESKEYYIKTHSILVKKEDFDVIETFKTKDLNLLIRVFMVKKKKKYMTILLIIFILKNY